MNLFTSSSLPEAFKRRLGQAALALLGLAVLAALWGTAARIQESMAAGREEAARSGQVIANALDHELDVFIASLHGMKYLSERFLTDRVRAVENPVIRLQPAPAQGGYQSVLPQWFQATDTVGRITGAGPVPALNDPVAREMAMAVVLTPLMRAIKERSPDIPWVQYASARGFMFIFPHRGSESFFFKRDLLQRDYFARATPQANPERTIFWSQPYNDAAGQGKIVTVTQPIYNQDDFLGSVSIDFKVASLGRYLRGTPIARTHVQLVTKEGAQLAQAWEHAVAVDGDHRGQHERIRIPLKNAPWLLELEIDSRELFMAAVRGRMWHFTAVLVLLVSFIFVILLSRSYRHARNLAITDGLTGLYNRRHFEIMAAHQFELARRGACTIGMVMLDIDFFKKYNDHYGHQQGDVALKAVAGVLQQTLRRTSDQVFRVGGEEFAALIVLQQPQELQMLMDKINQAVRDLALPHVEHPLGHMTVSIGATVIDSTHWLTVDAAYQFADELLYEAKTGGRDRAVVRTSGRLD